MPYVCVQWPSSYKRQRAWGLFRCRSCCSPVTQGTSGDGQTTRARTQWGGSQAQSRGELAQHTDLNPVTCVTTHWSIPSYTSQYTSHSHSHTSQYTSHRHSHTSQYTSHRHSHTPQHTDLDLVTHYISLRQIKSKQMGSLMHYHHVKSVNQSWTIISYFRYLMLALLEDRKLS